MVSKRVAAIAGVLALAGTVVLAAGGAAPSKQEPKASPAEKKSPTTVQAKKQTIPPWAKVSKAQIAYARKSHLPVARDLNLGSGVRLRMVLMAPGEFMMGSPENEKDRGDDEGPVHKAKITKPFYMGIHEVTQAQYKVVMGKNQSGFKGDNNPVESVSRNDAVEFCKKLSKKTGLEVRLPTEAEWEYACRAGTTTPFHFGETISTDQANYKGNYVYVNGRKGLYRKKTAPVGSFKPNAWGLYDMHGNVWEWCQDRYGEDYYKESALEDPKGPPKGSLRVVRGGSWVDIPVGCRSAVRTGLVPTGWGSAGDGFRVVVLAGTP